MKIYTLWQHDGDEACMPWCVDAIDEYTIEDNNGFTVDYLKNRDQKNVRELILEFPDKIVIDLFAVRTVQVSTITEPKE